MSNNKRTVIIGGRKGPMQNALITGIAMILKRHNILVSFGGQEAKDAWDNRLDTDKGIEGALSLIGEIGGGIIVSADTYPEEHFLLKKARLLYEEEHSTVDMPIPSFYELSEEQQRKYVMDAITDDADRPKKPKEDRPYVLSTHVARAKQLYSASVRDLSIHSNRTPSFGELDSTSQMYWINMSRVEEMEKTQSLIDEANRLFQENWTPTDSSEQPPEISELTPESRLKWLEKAANLPKI
jgi:hypothetical protein